MTIPQDTNLTRPWRKSTWSDTGGNCVEVAQAGSIFAVRDSKTPDGSFLGFSPAAWMAFTRRVKPGI